MNTAIKICGGGVYVRDTETSQYPVLWYSNVQNKWKKDGEKIEWVISKFRKEASKCV